MVDPMDTYREIGEIGPVAKAEADTFMQGLTKKFTKETPAPPELIQEGLEGILAKHKAKTSKLSSSTNKYLALAAAILLAIALGAPYTGAVAGYKAATAYAAMPIY